MFNYSKLRGRIKEKYGTQEAFAEKIGLTSVSISNKLCNKSDWSQVEMLRAASALEIDHSDIPSYFFVEAVKNI